MSKYSEYLNEIEERKGQGLHPKPIEGAELLKEIIAQVKDLNHQHRSESLNYFIYNTKFRKHIRCLLTQLNSMR